MIGLWRQIFSLPGDRAVTSHGVGHVASADRQYE